MITFSYTHPDNLVIISYHSRLYHWINHIKSWIIVIKSGFHVIIGCDLPVFVRHLQTVRGLDSEDHGSDLCVEGHQKPWQPCQAVFWGSCGVCRS